MAKKKVTAAKTSEEQKKGEEKDEKNGAEDEKTEEPPEEPVVVNKAEEKEPEKEKEEDAPTLEPAEKEEPKKEEPMKEELKKEEPMKEALKKEEPHKEELTKEKPHKEEPTKEEPQPEPVDPSKPTDRDICIGEDNHKGTILLHDLIRLHYVLLKKEKTDLPTEEKDIEGLASRLTKLMCEGKLIELSGLKDVPKPYLKGQGRFLEKIGDEWMKLNEDQAKAFVAKTILSQFKFIADETAPADIQDCVDNLFKNTDPANKSADEPSHHSAPRPCDVLFLPIEYPWEENMPYEHQSGNKHLLFLASQHVAADTNDSYRRIEAAFKLVTSQVEVNSGTELVQKTPRYVVQQLLDNQNSWKEMERNELAEFAAVFVFEVFLEKQIHGIGPPLSSQVANLLSEHSKPGTVPIDGPTPHDVLFGRGGMTNGHQGNRRFRDIIALHRPDYIRATKMDKPNVARRIVRAIRQGSPPGRFMKKCDDGKWYDVGDRCAAEKTSQGLRERSNAEKRQRSALREALRIRREDLVEGEGGESASKRLKTLDSVGLSGIVPAYVGVGAQLNYAGGIPLSLSMKEKPKESKSKKGKKGKDDASGDGESNSESLPPNAVDKDGNILVTDYDILCGRGGLTNHHGGNKRFRDIVALHRPDYVRAPKIQKPSVARVIVRAIRNGDPPGRFLRKDEKIGKWYDIGDKKAAEKTSQALREKTNEEKDREPAAIPFSSPTLVLPAPTPGTNPKGDEKGKDEETKEAKKDESGDVKKEDEAKKEENKEEASNVAEGESKEKDADAMEVDTADDNKGDEENTDGAKVLDSVEV